MMRRSPFKQLGQSMTEYTVVLVFGVMVLTTGPGGDVMQELLAVLKKNYEGYTFAISMSAPPDYEDADEYALVLESYGLEDEEIEKLAVDTAEMLAGAGLFNTDPADQLDEFKDSLPDMPPSMSDILDGASSFF
jgi:hypothetical protein